MAFVSQLAVITSAFVLSFAASQAQATMTLSGVPTGVSTFEEATTDGTTSTKPTIYGGFAGTCSGDNINTCSSCTDASGSGWKPCNPRNAYSSLKIHIEISVSGSSVAAGTTPIVQFDDATISPSSTSFDGSLLIVEVPWSEICSREDGWDSSCTTTSSETAALSGTLKIYFEDSTGDSLSMTVRGRYIDQAGSFVVYPSCNTDAGDSEPSTNVGFCYFEAFRGDAKIYSDPLYIHGEDYPATPVSGIDYDNIVFFYEEQTAADGGVNATTLARVSNANAFKTIGINTRLNPPAGDNRITGLENGKTYCLMMANQDKTGIISTITDISGGAGSQDPAVLCATPEKVVGLLDDKSCFIATAAFGSIMAPEVQSFREFRNQYLLSNKWGSQFVKLYYAHSPRYANIIAQSEILRGAVRIALWPLLIFAKATVQFGFAMTLLMISLLAGAVIVLIRSYKRGLR